MMFYGNYRYRNDYYGNQYRHYVERQSDGKFYGEIYNTRSGKTRVRSFSKRKMAIKWCDDNCTKAKQKQAIAIAESNKKKEEKKKANTIPKEEKKLIEAMKKIEHYEKLVKKCNTKIKTMTTRSKTYQKNIKKFKKQVDKIKKAQKQKTIRIPDEQQTWGIKIRS